MCRRLRIYACSHDYLDYLTCERELLAALSWFRTCIPACKGTERIWIGQQACPECIENRRHARVRTDRARIDRVPETQEPPVVIPEQPVCNCCEDCTKGRPATEPAPAPPDDSPTPASSPTPGSSPTSSSSFTSASSRIPASLPIPAVFADEPDSTDDSANDDPSEWEDTILEGYETECSQFSSSSQSSSSSKFSQYSDYDKEEQQTPLGEAQSPAWRSPMLRRVRGFEDLIASYRRDQTVIKDPIVARSRARITVVQPMEAQSAVMELVSPFQSPTMFHPTSFRSRV